MTLTFLDRNLLSQTADLLHENMPFEHLGIVCDTITYDIAAAQLEQQCDGRCELLHLGRRPRPSVDQAEKMRRALARCDALLAVGTGTVTDLTRYVAYRLNIPFASFATAATMNGYLSPTSSLLMGTHKQSVSALPARLCIADIDIISTAPVKLSRAGIGDILCRTSIESDLMLANRFSQTPYTPQGFKRLRDIDEELCTQPRDLSEQDEGLTRLIMEGLFVGGQLMQQYGSSAPCSQSEHMIAHTYEMLYGQTESSLLHGEAISVTTLTMARLQQKLVKRKPKLRALKPQAEHFKRRFGNANYQTIYETYCQKVLSEERCEQLNDEMVTLWPDLRAQMEASVMNALSLEKTLQRYGCFTKHQQLRWHKDRYEHAVTTAHLTRDRLTFLDIPAMDKTLRAEI